MDQGVENHGCLRGWKRAATEEVESVVALRPTRAPPSSWWLMDHSKSDSDSDSDEQQEGEKNDAKRRIKATLSRLGSSGIVPSFDAMRN